MYWKDYLYFTRPQRNGIRVLLLIILLFSIAPGLYRRLAPIQPADNGQFREEIIAFLEMLNGLDEGEGRHGDTGSNGGRPAGSGGAWRAGGGEERVAGDRFAGDGSAEASRRVAAAAEIRLHPVSFNPNLLTAAEWEAMGIPSHVARSIRNYLGAGGSFRFREDLQRIYLMEESWYHALEPYMELPSRLTAGADDEIAPVVAETLFIDINSADTTKLMEIRGIGSVFSQRIISYRELLGGYCHPDQLLEVFGMDSARWEQLAAQVIIDTTQIRKMNLNNVPFEELLRHPYIDRNLANSLAGIARQHGPLQSIEQVRRSYLVDEEVFARISPYLKVD